MRVRSDDRVLDEFEITVDDLAIHLLAQAPMARHPRLLPLPLKISQNLERVGDEACKIAKRARKLSHEPSWKLTMDIPKMAEFALQMLKTALDAFLRHEPAPARALIPQDKEVDALNKKVYRELA